MNICFFSLPCRVTVAYNTEEMVKTIFTQGGSQKTKQRYNLTNFQETHPDFWKAYAFNNKMTSWLTSHPLFSGKILPHIK